MRFINQSNLVNFLLEVTTHARKCFGRILYKNEVRLIIIIFYFILFIFLNISLGLGIQ